jgi:WD40 repeat protein
MGRVPSGPRFVLPDAHASEVAAVCFTEGSHRMFSGGPDKQIRMWDVATGRGSLKHPASGSVLCLDSKSQYLVSAQSDNVCRLYLLAGAAALRPKCSYTSHTDSVDAAYLSGDCERVYSTSRDCTIRCWSVARETLSHTTMVTSTACDIAVHSSVIASAHKDRSVRFFDARTGRVAGECANIHDNVVTSVRFLNDAQYVVSLSRDSTARVCDVRTLREVQKFSHEKLQVASNSTRIAVSPDDNFVAFPANGAVLCWEPRTNNVTVVKGGPDCNGALGSVAWSDDGKTIATGGIDRKVVMWW